MISIKPFILTLVFLNFSVADFCSAPANTWGPVCTSRTSLAGKKGTYINYMISVAGTSKVYCRAVGMGNYVAQPVCSWGWHDLGLVNPKYVSLIWDTNNSFPSIQCYANPTSASLNWTYTTGVSALSCIRSSNPFARNVNAEPENLVETAFT